MADRGAPPCMGAAKSDQWCLALLISPRRSRAPWGSRERDLAFARYAGDGGFHHQACFNGR